MNPEREARRELATRLRTMADNLKANGITFGAPNDLAADFRQAADEVEELGVLPNAIRVSLAARIAYDLSNCLRSSLKRELAEIGWEPFVEVVIPDKDNPFHFIVQALDSPLNASLDVLIHRRSED